MTLWTPAAFYKYGRICVDHHSVFPFHKMN